MKNRFDLDLKETKKFDATKGNERRHSKKDEKIGHRFFFFQINMIENNQSKYINKSVYYRQSKCLRFIDDFFLYGILKREDFFYMKNNRRFAHQGPKISLESFI